MSISPPVYHANYECPDTSGEFFCIVYIAIVEVEPLYWKRRIAKAILTQKHSFLEINYCNLFEISNRGEEIIEVACYRKHIRYNICFGGNGCTQAKNEIIF